MSRDRGSSQKSRTVRSKNDFKRKQRIREPYDTVLIVSEGGKTEPNYFKDLCGNGPHGLRLSSVNIIVDKESGGRNPGKLYQYAKEKRDNDDEYDYDHVYIVFDKDNHKHFEKTIDEIRRSESDKPKYHAIYSIPCFEIWLLLHFKYSAKPYRKSVKKSACACVIADLKKYIPDYEKSQKGIYAATADKLDTAIKHAKKLEKEKNKVGTKDSSVTTVYRLIEFLRNIKGTE